MENMKVVLSKRLRGVACTAGLALALGMGAGTSHSAELRFAYQGTLNALDPYSLNQTFALGMFANVYEGLTKRGKDLEIIPGLAESWEQVDPLTWRFHLRQGVTFTNGNPFTADDVLFSAERVRAENSDLRTRIPADAEFVKIDDHTVEVKLKSPNPILIAEWDTWYILDKEWAEESDMVAPVSAKDANPRPAAFTANGTGPFTIVEHAPGVGTSFAPNPDWWGEVEHNLDRVEFVTIAADGTRVAALLSGDVDLIDPVPLQDIPRLQAAPDIEVITGPETRTMHLGFNQMDEVLQSSDVADKNPFRDVRVRKAVYQAINEDAIVERVMRGNAAAAALLIASELFPRSGEFKRLPFDPDAARALLAEAGYPHGFAVTMDCPNDRYVNDEQICQAIVSMLAGVGIKVNLNAQPFPKWAAKVLASGGYDTDFYFIGWTPGSLDSWNVISSLASCRDEKGNGGAFNLGGYCNEEVDALADKILVETDAAARDDLIFQAYTIMTEDVSHVPLHQQTLAWGKRSSVEIVQRPDNQVLFYWARVN